MKIKDGGTKPLPLVERKVYEFAATKELLQRENVLVKLDTGKAVVDLLLSDRQARTLNALQCSLSHYSRHGTNERDFLQGSYKEYILLNTQTGSKRRRVESSPLQYFKSLVGEDWEVVYVYISPFKCSGVSHIILREPM